MRTRKVSVWFGDPAAKHDNTKLKNWYRRAILGNLPAIHRLKVHLLILEVVNGHSSFCEVEVSLYTTAAARGRWG